MANEEPTNEEPTQKVIPVHHTDLLLEVINSMGNDKSLSISLSVTFFVKGIIISGDVISFEKYMEKTSANLRAALNASKIDQKNFDAMREHIADIFDEICIMVTQSPKDQHMIHLDNVKLLNPNGQKIDINNDLWRGPLEAIDGFFLGHVTLS
jgi:hypothetical protein